MHVFIIIIFLRFNVTPWFVIAKEESQIIMREVEYLDKKKKCNIHRYLLAVVVGYCWIHGAHTTINVIIALYVKRKCDRFWVNTFYVYVRNDDDYYIEIVFSILYDVILTHTQAQTDRVVHNFKCLIK